MPLKFHGKPEKKKGGKNTNSNKREAEIGGENEGKTGKIGIKVVLCEVLAAREREREKKKGGKMGISSNLEIARDLGISHGFGSSQGFGMRRIPKNDRKRRNF